MKYVDMHKKTVDFIMELCQCCKNHLPQGHVGWQTRTLNVWVLVRADPGLSQSKESQIDIPAVSVHCKTYKM